MWTQTSAQEKQKAIPAADLPNGRYKSQVSPRLGIAYPISDRDVLSFHYGWTFQTPQRNFVFENRGSQSTVAVRGNPLESISALRNVVVVAKEGVVVVRP